MTKPHLSLINYKVIVIAFEAMTSQILVSKNLPEGQESFRGFYLESYPEGIIVVGSSWRRERKRDIELRKSD